MGNKLIDIELTKPEATILTVNKIANDLNNHANYILINSQVVMDIWNDALKIIKLYQKANPDLNISLHDLSFKEVEEIVPIMLNANVIGSGRVSEIANLIKSISSYTDYLGDPA
ncbi:MAG: hypothetical protein KAS21_01875 [Candidatus Aminicenantes bacterium]|nr:hypothetical protein [Candidatus Aminicenantes bacterium]